MKRHQRLALEVVASVLAPWGMPWRVHAGGKHMAVVVRLRDGSEHKFPISGTPRDSDCQLILLRQQLTAWLERTGHATGRGIAADRAHKHGIPRRRHRHITRRWEVAIDPDTGPARDPWATLRTRLAADDA